MSYYRKINQFLWKIKTKLYYKNKFFIYLLDFRTDNEIVKAKISVLIRLLTLDDSDSYCKAREINTKSEFEKRLSMGHFGICATYDEKIISYIWRSIKEFEDTELKLKITLPENYSYAYDAYTNPEYRRYGVYREMRTSTQKLLVEKGYYYAISIIRTSNEASIKAVEKLQGFKIGTLDSTIVLGKPFHKLDAVNKSDKNLLNSIFNIR